jgi:hypothetical protein
MNLDIKTTSKKIEVDTRVIKSMWTREMADDLMGRSSRPSKRKDSINIIFK